MERGKNRQDFISKLREKNFSPENITLAMWAYDLAKNAHRREKRDSGERYFEHPREMVYILLDEIGTTDINEVIIILLHDTGEDTAIFGSVKDSWEHFVSTATFRLTKAFNPVVAEFVIAFTKPEVDQLYFKDKASVMAFYIQGLITRPRLFLLKMVDRLHNLRSLVKKDLTKIQKQVTETRLALLPAFMESIKAANLDKKNLHRYHKMLTKIEKELVILEALL